MAIYTKDHRPPHVHVIGNGGKAKISIEPYSTPVIVRAKGLTPKELEAALAVVDNHHMMLLERWRRIHGDA